MTAVIVQQMLVQRRRLIGWSAVGGGVTLLVQLLLFPSMRGALEEINDALPSGFAEFVGTTEMASIEGFLQAEAFGLLAPLLALVVGTALGASTLAGQEESGALVAVATAPIARRTIVTAAAVAVVTGVAALAATYLVVAIVGLAIIGESVAFGNLVAATIALWLFGSTVGSVSLAVGAVTGRRGVAVGVSSAVALASYLNYAVVPLADAFDWARRISLWFPYAASEPLRNGPDGGHLLVLVLLIAVGVTTAQVGFERRDVCR